MGLMFFKCCQRVSSTADETRCVDCVESDRAKSVAAAVAADRARIAQAIRDERSRFGLEDEAFDTLDRLLRVVEGG